MGQQDHDGSPTPEQIKERAREIREKRRIDMDRKRDREKDETQKRQAPQANK